MYPAADKNSHDYIIIQVFKTWNSQRNNYALLHRRMGQHCGIDYKAAA